MYRLAKKRGWETKLVAMPGGGNCKLYDVSGEFTPSTTGRSNEKDALSTVSSSDIPDLRPKMVIPLDLQKQVEHRARLCELILEALNESESRMETWVAMTASYNAGELLPELFKLEGKHGERTLRRWVKQYKAAEKCSAALIRSRKLGQPERCLMETEKNFLLHLLLSPNRVSIGSAIRKLKQMEALDRLESTASKITLRRWCEEWRDSHKLAFDIIDPATGKPRCIMLIMFYDWASRYPVGASLAVSEDSQHVLLALRNSIMHWGGRPKYVYLDNGKAFRSKLFNKQWERHDLSKELVGIFPRLGIGVTFAKATMPERRSSSGSSGRSRTTSNAT